MIDSHKNLTSYYIEHELHYVNKYVNNGTSMQMAPILLIVEKIHLQNNGRSNILIFVLFGKLLHFNILIHIKKNEIRRVHV